MSTLYISEQVADVGTDGDYEPDSSTYTVWDSFQSGNQVSNLLSRTSSPITAVTPDANMNYQIIFYALTNTGTLWLDDASGKPRHPVQPAGLADSVDDVMRALAILQNGTSPGNTATQGSSAENAPVVAAQRLRATWFSKSKETTPQNVVSATGAAGAASVIPSSALENSYDRVNQWTNLNMRFSGSAPIPAGAAVPLSTGLKASGLSDATLTLSMVVEFDTVGDTQFELVWYGAGASGRFQVWVNDMHVGYVNGNATAGVYRTLINLQSNAENSVRIIASSGSQFLGIQHTTAMSLMWPRRPKGRRIIFAGDGFARGMGATFATRGMPRMVAALLEEYDVWSSGIPNTGYLAGGAQSITNRLGDDILSSSPDVVVFCAGTADASLSSGLRSSIVDAAVTCWTSVQNIPNTVVICVGPFVNGTTDPGDSVALLNRDLKAAAFANGVHYIDPIGEDWINDDNAARYIGADGLNFSDSGHFYVASLVAGHMEADAADYQIDDLDPWFVPELTSGSNRGVAPGTAAGDPPVNTAAPAITGTAQVGNTLAVSLGSWTNSPTSYEFSWAVGGQVVSGSNDSSYAPLPADVGKTIRCTVTARNGAGSATAISGYTAAVTAAPTTVTTPTNATVPKITGTAQVGQSLNVTTGTWNNNPTNPYTYQWKAAGTAISGATSSSYTPVTGDVGKALTVTVSASNSAGSASATSAATAAVIAATSNPVTVPVNNNLPAISDSTPQVAQVLTASTGDWSSTTTLTYTYQWKADGASISGATTSSYTPTASVQGKKLTVQVTAKNTAGSVPATSAPTTAVAAAPLSLWSAGKANPTLRYIGSDLPVPGTKIATWPSRSGGALTAPASTGGTTTTPGTTTTTPAAATTVAHSFATAGVAGLVSGTAYSDTRTYDSTDKSLVIAVNVRCAGTTALVATPTLSGAAFANANVTKIGFVDDTQNIVQSVLFAVTGVVAGSGTFSVAFDRTAQAAIIDITSINEATPQFKFGTPGEAGATDSNNPSFTIDNPYSTALVLVFGCSRLADWTPGAGMTTLQDTEVDDSGAQSFYSFSGRLSAYQAVGTISLSATLAGNREWTFYGVSVAGAATTTTSGGTTTTTTGTDQQPVVATVSGEQYAQFDGVDDELNLLTNPTVGVQTICVVARTRKALGTQVPIFSTGTGEVSRSLNSPDKTNGAFSGGTLAQVANGTTNKWRVIIFTGTAAQLSLRVDDLRTALTAGSKIVSNALALGRNVAKTSWGQVDIMEVIGWNTVATVDDEVAIRQAMFTRYGSNILVDPSTDTTQPTDPGGSGPVIIVNPTPSGAQWWARPTITIPSSAKTYSGSGSLGSWLKSIPTNGFGVLDFDGTIVEDFDISMNDNVTVVNAAGKKPIMDGNLRISGGEGYKLWGLSRIEKSPDPGSHMNYLDGGSPDFAYCDISMKGNKAGCYTMIRPGQAIHDWNVHHIEIHDNPGWAADVGGSHDGNQDHGIYAAAVNASQNGRIHHCFIYNMPSGRNIKVGGPASGGAIGGITIDHCTLRYGRGPSNGQVSNGTGDTNWHHLLLIESKSSTGLTTGANTRGGNKYSYCKCDKTVGDNSSTFSDANNNTSNVSLATLTDYVAQGKLGYGHLEGS